MIRNGESVVWHERTETGRDAYNRPVVGWVDHVVENVAVAPGSTSEPRLDANMNRLRTEMSLYLVHDPGIKSSDQITVRGVRYEVEGDVSGGWSNPFTGTSFGSEITLRRVTG